MDQNIIQKAKSKVLSVAQGILGSKPGQVVSKFGGDLNKTLQNIGMGTGSALQTFVSQPLAGIKVKNMMTSQNLASQAMQEKIRQQQGLPSQQNIPYLLSQSRAYSNTPDFTSSNLKFAESNLQKRIDTGTQQTGIAPFLKYAAPAANVGLTGKGLKTISAMPILQKVGTLGVSAGISGIAGALSGQNPLESAVAGVLQTPRIVGLTGISSPATKYGAAGIMDKISSPLARNIMGRGLTGLGNVVEDEILSRLDSIKPGVADRVLSFGIGAFLAPVKEYEDYLKSEKPEVAQKIRQVVRDIQGRYAKKIGVKPESLNYFMTSSGRKIIKGEAPKMFGQDVEKISKFLEDNIPGAKQGFGNIAEPVGGNNAVMNADISKGLTPEVTTKVKIKPKIKPATVQEPIQLPVKNISPTEKLSLPQGDYTLKQPIGETTSKYNIGKNKTVNQRVLKQALGEVAPSFEKVSGSPITHEQIIKQAGEFSDEVVKTIGRQTTEQLGAAQLRLRQNIANMADSGQVTPELLEAMKTDASFARSTAQLLGQRAIDANPRTPYGKNMIKYVEEVNRVANDIDLVIEKAKGVDFNNPEQAATFYREFIKPTAGDWIDKVRFSSMLSSPNTVINNASSNLQGTGLLAPIEKTISGGIDAIVSGLTGSQRKYFAGEGVEYAKGYWSNMGKALQNFSDAMKGGSDAAEMYNVPLTKQGTGGRVAENTLSFFPRLAQATDELFKALTTGGLEKANAYRTTKGGVNQTADQIATEAKRRLFNQPFGSDQSYLLNALEFIPSKIMDATHSKNPFIKWTAKFAFPFIRIPTNVFKAGIEYSPLGVTTLPGANNKIEQASKALMGTTVALGAWQLANADRLTFGMPTSEKQRDSFTAAGMQPYSIKIGDKWISYTKFHPVVGFNMALASALKEQLDKKTISDDQMDTVIGVAGKWLTYFANQSYVKQMGDFMSLQSGNETAIGKAIGNYPSQLIPFRALMGWIARAFDPNERKIDPDGSKIDKSLQSIMMSIPGIRNTLMPRTDSMGEPVKQQNRFLNLVSPAKITNEVPGEKQIYENLKQKSIQTSKENAIKAELKKSDNQVSELGANRYAIVDKISGNVNTIDLNPIEKPTVTGNAESDKKLFSNYNSKITSQITGVNKLLEANYIDQNKAEQLIAELQSQRPNKTKVTSSKKVSTKKISTRKPKQIKLKSIKVPKVKQIKVKQIKVPKAKVIKLGKLKKPKTIKLKTIKYKK